MKISYSWLKEHIDIDLSPEKVADILTRTGLEVDEHHPVGVDPEALEDLVVGYVEEVRDHPNADKLVLTKVDVGDEYSRPIVCGAPNVETGQKVIVALPGTTVYPLNADPMKIKKAKIRGEASEGMICSAAEIGASEDHEGILVLDSDPKVGSSVRKLFEGQGDHLFEIDITPNRADAISVLGTARDLDAYLQVHEGRSLRKGLETPELPDLGEEKLPIKVEVEDEKACPRYCGVSIKGVQVGPSPEWLQEKLKSIDAVPINNVVDVTNYILHDLGQPLHAFDASAIKGQKVRIGFLEGGTTFTTLDEEKRELDGSELMIADDERNGMCMAGVLGGVDSGVGEGTQDVFLESAYFDPGVIRRGSSRHGLSTEASFRFERGVDPEITRFALERAASLILELAGGELGSRVQDTHPQGFEWAKVSLDHERITEQVGERIDQERIHRILQALEMKVEEDHTVRVPPYREDVTREADLLEEILRIHGYDRIELPERMTASVSHRSEHDMGRVRRDLSEMLAGLGFHEIASNSLVHSQKAGEWHDPEQEVRILNPISSELDVLRQSLLHSALPVIAHNIKRKASDLQLFELGKVYWKADQGYEEEERLALYLTGQRSPENWRNDDEAFSFFDLKSYVERVLQRCGVLNKTELREETPPHLQDGVSLIRKGRDGELLVAFGTLDPDAVDFHDIGSPVLVAEFRVPVLFEAILERDLRYRPISKHLPVRKDMAFIVDKGQRFEELKRTAFEAEEKLLKEVELFDLYEGEKIGEGKRSYAMKFVFHDEEKTLEDQEIDGAMQRISDALYEHLGAELRDH